MAILFHAPLLTSNLDCRYPVVPQTFRRDSAENVESPVLIVSDSTPLAADVVVDVVVVVQCPVRSTPLVVHRCIAPSSHEYPFRLTSVLGPFFGVSFRDVKQPQLQFTSHHAIAGFCI